MNSSDFRNIIQTKFLNRKSDFVQTDQELIYQPLWRLQPPI